MIEITIQEGSPVVLSAAETVETVAITVADSAEVNIDINESGNSTILTVNDAGQLIELTVNDTAETVNIDIDEAAEVVVVVDETQRIVAPDKLDDLNVTVDADGPVGGTATWLLPVEWKGKRFRLFRAGLKFYNWNITVGSPQDTLNLLGGSVWMGTDENGPGFEEIVSIENY